MGLTPENHFSTCSQVGLGDGNGCKLSLASKGVPKLELGNEIKLGNELIRGDPPGRPYGYP
jgi:hypothetical protein